MFSAFEEFFILLSVTGVMLLSSHQVNVQSVPSKAYPRPTPPAGDRVPPNVLGTAPLGLHPAPAIRDVNVPYYASLELIVGKVSDPICGGAIISNDSILTAASCFLHLDVEKEVRRNCLVARVGHTKTGGKGYVHEVSKVIFHKKYEHGKNTDLDLAIAKVYRPFDFGKDSDVEVVELQDVTKLSKADGIKKVFAVGFGLLRHPKHCRKELASTNGKISEKEFEVLEESVCQRKLETLQLENTNRQRLCVLQNDFVGDKGGPLVFNNTLIGILSWEIDWQKNCIPAIYSSVSHNYAWIRASLE